MSNKQFDYLVFVGRFQPLHIGHFHVVQEALKKTDNLIFVIGSHDKPRDSKNPFTTEERISIMKAALKGIKSEFHYLPQYDYTYNEEKWIAGVQASVNSVIFSNFKAGPIRVGIIGYSKDHSSYYIKKFPAWEIVEVEPRKYDYNGKVINATDLRTELFVHSSAGLCPAEFVVSSAQQTEIEKFVYPIHDQIREEFEFLANYRKQWESVPYPVTFNTVDGVVTQSGHILLVQRGAMPGKGLWALPGGFINPKETLKEAVIRELREETQIDVPVPVLNGSIVKCHTYDAPDRSLRGRTITTAFHFKLNDMAKLPKIKGSDDAQKAKWFPLSEFITMRSKMFEDHFAITENMLGL